MYHSCVSLLTISYRYLQKLLIHKIHIVLILMNFFFINHSCYRWRCPKSRSKITCPRSKSGSRAIVSISRKMPCLHAADINSICPYNLLSTSKSDQWAEAGVSPERHLSMDSKQKKKSKESSHYKTELIILKSVCSFQHFKDKQYTGAKGININEQ